MANWQYQEYVWVEEAVIMEALVAAGAFIGLFGLWVLLPKKLLKK